MKIPNYLFWSILVLIALFYITTGNGMHKERLSVLKITPKDVNISKDTTK
ncbi:MAG: hypothetical protein KAQ94_04640 [Arcobacteraceae bacterium]|nr:hypothetical protein [Arcobacteraceae bacterium]